MYANKKEKKERKKEKLRVCKHAVEFGHGYEKRRDKLNLFSLVFVFCFWQVLPQGRTRLAP